MSEIQEPKKTPKELMKSHLADTAFVKQEWDGRGVDPLLQWLVIHTNATSSNKHAVTLTVGGNLVSGILISADAFLDKWAEDFSANFTSDNGTDESMKKLVLSWKFGLNVDSNDLPPAQLIHLEDAEVYSSSGRPILPGGSLWRGKISSVDGFNLGRLVYETK
jgi:hypothetical protein